MSDDEDFDRVRVVASNKIKPGFKCDWAASMDDCNGMAQWIVEMRLPVLESSPKKWRTVEKLHLCSHCTSNGIRSFQ